MIKVQKEIATREPIPQFLVGLAQESLQDLSWTDPALSVQDAAWWPEEDQSPALGPYERYGDETLTLDVERKVVIVMREVKPWCALEIAADQAEKAAAAREEAKRDRQAAVDAIQVTTDTGKVFDGDETSQGRMARAILALQLSGATETAWVLADNTPATVALQELQEALVLAGQEQTRIWMGGVQ